MSRELDAETECFRKAAELGCKDFEVYKNEVMLLIPACGVAQLPSKNAHSLIRDNHRINRYAAAVCAEWAWEQSQDSAKSERVTDYLDIQFAARAFGRKFGGTQK